MLAVLATPTGNFSRPKIAKGLAQRGGRRKDRPSSVSEIAILAIIAVMAETLGLVGIGRHGRI